ncbi:putative disease resistance protein RGA3 [Coffea arabica]|uniref:Disease resistance protein RGA3 n=1 Tax=Coffea arabica TaxID=13443 RepID=A0ABM4VZC3_COFAR
MADSAVNATIQVALKMVVSLAAEHVNLAREFPKELERLNESAEMIRGFLAGADEEMHSPVVQDWLKQLEEEVFKADNVLDELNYENLRRKVNYQNQPMKKKVFFCFSFFSKIGFRSRLGSMIREVNTNLERIHGHARGLGLAYKCQVEEAFPNIAAGAAKSRQTDSKIVRRDVLGRDEDESKIVKKLLTESESDSISVISITGPPGLGKTTLAKAVFNTPQFDNHFNKKIWVCVAKEVEIMELFKMILESSTRKKAEVDSREVIVEGIETELKEKRYLLVLDDLWNHQEGLLNDFFTTLEALKPKKGIWCLVTSRLQEVAIVLSRHRRINFTRHDLRKLYDDDCWSIVKNWATIGEEVPKELEALRKQVLRRCDGLPLAATLIGGLLSKKRKEDWLSILEESLLNGDQCGIEQILKVSFDHLSPAPVKKCFAYCSIFDQDTKLEQDLLVEHWMAEGFLQPDSQNQTMEGIGYEYLRTLLQTSLLEEVNEGWRTWYKMHDLVHDFAKSILNRNSSNQDRYLAVYSPKRINEKASASLRTLFLEGGMADDMLSKFKYLHVLKLFGADVKELPTSIGKLIHLHLLDISDSMITTLPESLCKLYRLQTLRIGKLEEGFPKKTSNLISMRHLHYHDDAGCKIQMPSSIGQWSCLQTLEFFNIGRQEEDRGIQELGTLQDLKGSLEIRNLELVNGKDDAELANLSRKPNLYQLILEWGNRDRESDKCDEDVLEGLQPHPNLKELHIRNFRGDQIPQWLVKSSTLVELHLIDCRELTVPTLGQLSSLQRLYLCGLENTTCIGLSFYGISDEEDGRLGGSGTVRRQTFFPALKILSLESMKSFEEWKDAHVFRVLEKLYIRDCPRLTTIPTLSCFPSLDVLEIRRNCHVLLVEKVLSNIANLSSLKLRGRGPMESLNLVKQPESSLTIDGCDSLSTDMLERLCLFPILQSVELWECPNITTLRGMSCAACLKTLVVIGCENLRELPEDLYQFQALEHLEIWGCPRINSFGLNPNKGQKSLLKSLEELIIIGCDGLTRLPVEMFEPCMSLRRLTLSGCHNLRCLLDLAILPTWEVAIDGVSGYSVMEFDWVGLASSSTLRHVSLSGMLDTKSLPHQLQDFEAIEAFPDWLGNLVSLEELFLFNCKKLPWNASN